LEEAAVVALVLEQAVTLSGSKTQVGAPRTNLPGVKADTYKMNIETILQRAISPDSVLPDGRLTDPRSYGVYELPARTGVTTRFRIGNHPIRMLELGSEFTSCNLRYLFLPRGDAVLVAASLNSTWFDRPSEVAAVSIIEGYK
jgi:hypothetical protein